MSDTYEPIDCGFHDHIEAHISLREKVRVVYRGDNEDVTVEDRIIDWFSKDGAEYMQLANGAIIRLDRIVSIDKVTL